MNKNLVNKTNRLYKKFYDESGFEPNYVECIVKFKDDNSIEQVTITFNSEFISNDDIFYYCYDVENLIELMSETEDEDFMITDVIEFF